MQTENCIHAPIFIKWKRFMCGRESRKRRSQEQNCWKKWKKTERRQHDQGEKCEWNEKKKKKKKKKKRKMSVTHPTRGKGPSKQKKAVEITSNTVSRIEVQNTECCLVCGKFQPDALNLNYAIWFVEGVGVGARGFCNSCGKLVRLNFCCDVQKLSDSDDFKCPRCCNEQ